MLRLNYIQKITLYALIGGCFMPSFAFAQNWTILSTATSSVIQNTTGLNLNLSLYGHSPTLGGYVDIYTGSTSLLTASNYDNSTFCYATPTQYCSIFTVIPPANYYRIEFSAGTYKDILFGYQEDLVNPTINNPNQDIFNGILIMWGCIFFVIWFFKIDRKNKSS